MEMQKLEVLKSDIKSSEETSPIELSKLRISQNYLEMASVKKATVTIPVRKPHRQEFVRTHPDTDNFWFSTAVLNYEESTDREVYIVSPELRDEYATELTPVALITSVNRQGVLFLWMIKLPPEDGRQNEWNRSALEGAQMAREKWVRMISNKHLGAYEPSIAAGNLPEPEWPKLSLDEIVRIAFRDKYIDSREHPILRRLGGLV